LVNSAIVYTDCASQSCAVNKWKVPGREDLICITPDLQEYWSDRGCTGSILGYSTSYNRGECSTNGSGSCYAIDISSFRGVRPKSMWDLAYVSYCYPLSSAGAYDRYTCTWTCESGCGQKIYIPSGSHRIKYTGSGTCSSGGAGGCYKLESGKTYFTGNALGTACGASGCSSGVYYDDSRQCWWLSTLYSYSVGGSPVQAYLGRGSCNTGGTGSCYKLTGGSTGYTGGSGCGGGGCSDQGTYYSGSTACSWIPFSTKLYTASGSTTKTVGSGTCTSDGTGNCYKLTGGSSYYTGNGVCGSGGCGSGTYYTGSTTCQYYAGAACNYHVKNP